MAAMTKTQAVQMAGRAQRETGSAALGSMLRAIANGEGYISYAGSPNGTVTPDNIGQWLWDSTNSVFYRATGLTSSSWDLVVAATAINGGTVGTGVTAAESAAGENHTTILTCTGIAMTIGDTAALADGALIYTFPAGPIVVNASSFSLGLTLTTGTPTTDTPEIGLGTVIGTGVVATLGAGAATWENIGGPVVLADCAGAAGVGSLAPGLVIETAGAHTVHINIADTWANVDDTAATVAGTVTLNWTRVPLS